MKTKNIKVSSENQWFQRAEALKRSREKRQHYRQFLVEGVWSINQIVANSIWVVEAFIYSRERKLSNWALGILRNNPARWHLGLTNSLMERLSDKEETSELLAIVEMPSDGVERIPIEENALIILLDRPSNPGNLGTLIRSCDALGCQGAIITGHAADLFDPGTIRAAAGSFFALPVARLASHDEILSWINKARSRLPKLQIVGTSAHAQVDAASHIFTVPTILVVGNETTGISRWYRDVCDTIVGIPMSGSASSLNVACATTALLYEIQRQRHREN